MKLLPLPLAVFFIFFTSPVYAISTVEIIQNRLELGVMATYVAPLNNIDDFGQIIELDRAPGTIVTDNYVGSLFLPNQNQGSFYLTAQSNIVWGHSDASYSIASNSFYMYSTVALDDDFPSRGITFPPIGTTAIAQSTWKAIFRVKGDGAILDSQGYFSDIRELYDLTIGSVVFSGHGNIYSYSLLDNHSYSFSSNIITKQSGYVGSAVDDTGGAFNFSISNAHVTVPVPAPGSCALLLSGMLSFFAYRRTTR